MIEPSAFSLHKQLPKPDQDNFLKKGTGCVWGDAASKRPSHHRIPPQDWRYSCQARGSARCSVCCGGEDWSAVEGLGGGVSELYPLPPVSPVLASAPSTPQPPPTHPHRRYGSGSKKRNNRPFKKEAFLPRPNPPNTEFRRFYERGDLPVQVTCRHRTAKTNTHRPSPEPTSSTPPQLKGRPRRVRQQHRVEG